MSDPIREAARRFARPPPKEEELKEDRAQIAKREEDEGRQRLAFGCFGTAIGLLVAALFTVVGIASEAPAWQTIACLIGLALMAIVVPFLPDPKKKNE